MHAALNLAGEPIEERRQFLLFCVIRLASRKSHTGQVIPQAGQSDGSQVSVLDGPTSALAEVTAMLNVRSSLSHGTTRRAGFVSGGILLDRRGRRRAGNR